MGPTSNRSRERAHSPSSSKVRDEHGGSRRYSRFRNDFNHRNWSNDNGNYNQRGSTFGRRWINRGRGYRGRNDFLANFVNREVYKPKEDDKPKLNLFDPTEVPKGRSYFEHEDRSYQRLTPRGRRPGFSRPFGTRFPQRFNKTGDDLVWSHDKFMELETASKEKSVSPAKDLIAPAPVPNEKKKGKKEKT